MLIQHTSITQDMSSLPAPRLLTMLLIVKMHVEHVSNTHRTVASLLQHKVMIGSVILELTLSLLMALQLVMEANQ